MVHSKDFKDEKTPMTSGALSTRSITKVCKNEKLKKEVVGQRSLTSNIPFASKVHACQVLASSPVSNPIQSHPVPVERHVAS